MAQNLTAQSADLTSPWERRRVRFSLLIALGAAAGCTAAAIYRTMGLDMVPLIGPDASVAQLIVYSTFVMGLLIPAVGYRRLAEHEPSLSLVEQLAAAQSRQILARVVVSVAVGFIVFILSASVFLLLNLLFTGAAYTRASVILFSAAYGGVLGYYMAYWVVTLQNGQILNIGAALLLFGVTLAMAAASERRWWTKSISFLGHDSSAAYIFNVSIILGGLIALAAVLDLLQSLRLLYHAGQFPKRGFLILSITLPLICLLLSAIGLFPTTITPLSNLLHDISSHTMALTIVGLMFFVAFSLPIYPQPFTVLSFIFGVLCVGFIILYFGPRVINFVTMEIFLLGACGLWMTLLRRHTIAYIREQSKTFVPPGARISVQPEPGKAGSAAAGTIPG